MGKLSLGGVLVCVAASFACNGDSTSPGTTTDPFVGRWACSEELSLTFTVPAGRPPSTTTEMSTLNITGSGGALTATKESDGSAGCKVSFTSNGSTGTLSEGQTCTTSRGVMLTYTSGSATVNGSSMNSTFSFEASGTIVENGMMISATATGTQNATCSRLSPPPGGGGATTTGGW